MLSLLFLIYFQSNRYKIKELKFWMLVEKNNYRKIIIKNEIINNHIG